MVKDPATGKRVSRTNDASQHKTGDVPHLRIVAQDIWDKAQAIKGSNSKAHVSAFRKKPRILSASNRQDIR